VRKFLLGTSSYGLWAKVRISLTLRVGKDVGKDLAYFPNTQAVAVNLLEGNYLPVFMVVGKEFVLLYFFTCRHMTGEAISAYQLHQH
jgi:hypothetical protein